MYEVINKIKRVVRFCIPDLIWLLKYYGQLKKVLGRSSINHIRPYSFFSWHSGFNYFVGNCNGEKVFIKFCGGKYNTIPSEVKVGSHLDFGKHPKIIGYGEYPFPWIATAFINAKSMSLLKPDEYQHFIEELVLILDELFFSGIIHRDLRPENICIDANGNVIIIDFGWALYKEFGYSKTNYELIERILNQEFRDESGKYDDALSVYLSIRKVFPSISNELLAPIKERIGRFSA